MPGLIIQHMGQFVPLARQHLTIGRAPDNILVLADPQVSAYHAVISWQADPNRHLLKDLGSTNGTYLNERRVAGPGLLRHGDAIRLGDTILGVSSSLSFLNDWTGKPNMV